MHFNRCKQQQPLMLTPPLSWRTSPTTVQSKYNVFNTSYYFTLLHYIQVGEPPDKRTSSLYIIWHYIMLHCILLLYITLHQKQGTPSTPEQLKGIPAWTLGPVEATMWRPVVEILNQETLDWGKISNSSRRSKVKFLSKLKVSIDWIQLNPSESIVIHLNPF